MAPMKLITPLLILGLLLTACGAGGGMAELPTPQINVNSAPDAEGTAVAYLSAWNEGNYTAMYEMLTEASKQAISAQDFQDRYAMVATQTNLFRVDYEILSSLTNPRTAQVGYRVTLNSAVIGAVTRETSMNLELEGGLWRVMWEERIILPELAGGNTLSLERFVPTRGIIYDHNGDPIAANTGAVAVGVYPWAIVEGDESDVLSELARVSQRSVAEINELVFPEDREADYYVPIAEVSQEEFDARAGDWTELSGIYFYNYDTRLYFGGGAAPQTVGYYGPIPAEEVPNYIPLGYQSSDWIGRMGIERWGEEYLAGRRGGALYVLDPNGQVVTKLAETGAQPASSILTTLDLDLQLRAQEAIRDFTGAIVVLERDTGRVLAMVSSPGFNQNWADPADFNSFWETYFPDDSQRFFNRATQGQYAPGSIFKLITFSAGLESGLFQPESILDCTQQWFGLAGIVLDNWTVEKELPADGELSYLQGLMRSCNIWYYQIGLDLYNAGMVDAVGVATLSFEPEAKGTLPISESTLTNLQNAMRMVVADPRGTAQRQFSGFSIPVYGKTGTATAGEGVDPHAWFIGYTDAGRPDQADIAIAVLVENIGDGSEFAAPIWRRVASYYFFGAPDRLYPWESAFGVLDPIYFDETLQAEATSTAEAE